MTTMPPGSRPAWLVGLALSVLAYTIVFRATRDAPFLDDLVAAALNTISLGIAALGVRRLLRVWVLRLEGGMQWLAHPPAAAAFTMGWTWLLYLSSGILQAGSATRFSVVPFLEGPAQQWQILQGLFAYVAVAALTLLEHRPAGAVVLIDNGGPDCRAHFLVRSNSRLLTLAATEIVSVIGADDYAEVVTGESRHLVSTSLDEFERALDPARFLRVHRSAIANLDQVLRAEAVGGGRMRLAMSAGPELAVSRTGAKRLRERAL